ncbi:MAG: hypothetical protein ABMA64_41005, partial [Myxococcota bacterium]
MSLLPWLFACVPDPRDSDVDVAEVTPDQLLAGGDCPAPTGPGTEHATWISADETWSAADSPHRIPYTLRLTAR